MKEDKAYELLDKDHKFYLALGHKENNHLVGRFWDGVQVLDGSIELSQCNLRGIQDGFIGKLRRLFDEGESSGLEDKLKVRNKIFRNSLTSKINPCSPYYPLVLNDLISIYNPLWPGDTIVTQKEGVPVLEFYKLEVVEIPYDRESEATNLGLMRLNYREIMLGNHIHQRGPHERNLRVSLTEKIFIGHKVYKKDAEESSDDPKALDYISTTGWSRMLVLYSDDKIARGLDAPIPSLVREVEVDLTKQEVVWVSHLQARRHQVYIDLCRVPKSTSLGKFAPTEEYSKNIKEMKK